MSWPNFCMQLLMPHITGRRKNALCRKSVHKSVLLSPFKRLSINSDTKNGPQARKHFEKTNITCMLVDWYYETNTILTKQTAKCKVKMAIMLSPILLTQDEPLLMNSFLNILCVLECVYKYASQCEQAKWKPIKVCTEGVNKCQEQRTALGLASKNSALLQFHFLIHWK